MVWPSFALVDSVSSILRASNLPSRCLVDLNLGFRWYVDLGIGAYGDSGLAKPFLYALYRVFPEIVYERSADSGIGIARESQIAFCVIQAGRRTWKRGVFNAPLSQVQ
jgi:hypothetical protein